MFSAKQKGTTMQQIDEALTTINDNLMTLRATRQAFISIMYRSLLNKAELFYAHKRLTKNLKETLR